jgi:hypothetical protein
MNGMWSVTSTAFADDERRHRGNEEAAELDAVLLQDHLLCPEDQVEADEEEDRRRQKMLHLPDVPGERAAPEGPLRVRVGTTHRGHGGASLPGLWSRATPCPCWASSRSPFVAG